MAAITDATIVNNNSKKFLFRGVTAFQVKKEQPATVIPFVSSSAGNTIIFKFSGQVEKISFKFAIFNDGTDVADGTHTSTVITIPDQIDYLKNTVWNADFDGSHTFTQARYYSAGQTVAVLNIDFDQDGGITTLVTGTCQLHIGRLASL